MGSLSDGFGDELHKLPFLTCSSARPWGVHEQLLEGLCGRCGWDSAMADRSRQLMRPVGALPERSSGHA